MIDLIDEASADLAKFGYDIKTDRFGIEIGRLCVDSAQKAKALGFRQGEYVIVNSPLVYSLEDCHDAVTKILKEHLKTFLHNLKIENGSRFFVVGVGNPDILADSLGKKVVDKIEIDAFDSKNNIFKICPNIYFNTGISTFDTVKVLVDFLKPDCTILIDSLATNNISRLGTSFQINTVGLTPGSALKQNNKFLDSKNLKCKCLSFGVPFMIFASEFDKAADPELILAPKDIHENIEVSSQIIADAISGAIGGEK